MLLLNQRNQKVLNDLQWSRLSLSRIILLLPHPLLSVAPVNKINRQNTGRLRNRDNLLTGEGGGVGEEPSHTIARKSSPP
jgi:hypothetical protein